MGTGSEGGAFWDHYLKDCDEKNYVFNSGVKPLGGNRGEKKRADGGLIEGHAYSLIGVKEVENKDGDTVRLIQLRNPWGSYEWSGRWSDSDEAMWGTLSDEVKKSLAPNGRNPKDGLFYLEYDDFLRLMQDVTLCEHSLGKKRG